MWLTGTMQLDLTIEQTILVAWAIQETFPEPGETCGHGTHVLADIYRQLADHLSENEEEWEFQMVLMDSHPDHPSTEDCGKE